MKDLIQNLSATELVLWIIAIPSTIVFLIFAIGVLFGFGDFDTDTDTDTSTDAGLALFSVNTIITFLMVFSWSNLFFIELKFGPVLSIILSLTITIVVLYKLSSLFKLLNKLKDEKTANPESSIGDRALVTLDMAPGKQGKIEIELSSGGTTEFFAINNSDTPMKRGDLAHIIHYRDGIYYVSSVPI